MPSSMPISSSSAPSIIGHHNHNLHHLHQQPAHRHPHQTHQLNALIHSQIQPPQTGLQATTSTSLPHHHYHGSTSSSSSSSTLTSTAHPLAPSSSIHHAAPHLTLHSHVTSSTLTPLQQQQTNHLPTPHGHLIPEIYDIAAANNKRPRLINPYNPNAATGIHMAVSNSSNTTSGVPLMTIPTSHIGYPPTSLIHPHFQPAVNNNNIVVDPLSLQPSTSNSLRSTLPLNQQLLIETNEESAEDGYNPHFEAISPTPNDDSRVSPFSTLKDQILSAIHSCDRQIQTFEQHVNQLRSQAQELEMATRKPPLDTEEETQKNTSRSEPTLVQKIYLENSMKAKKAHQLHNFKENSSLNGETILNFLPLYNQPIDIKETRKNHENYLKNREKLIKYIRKKKEEKRERYRARAEKYDEMMMKWLKQIELIESDPAKKARDAKAREYFEKQFPELKKKREDRERLQRGAQRVRSDADFEEIMDGIQDQELSDKKMHSYAVIPPIMYDDDERRKKIKYNNNNGFLKDPMALHKQHKMINIWTDGEKAIFREKYLTHPKKFGFVAQFLERKSIADCVEYYYLSKKAEHYKQVLSKHNKKRTRAVIRAQQQNLINQQQQPVGILPRSVDNSGAADTFKKYKRATSVILPYSMPLSSSTNTITFTILPPTNSSSTSNDLTFSSSSPASQVTNGPLIVSSNSTLTSVSCLTTTSLTSVASTNIKCDNNVNNNTMATHDGTNCDNSGSGGDLTNNCCLICRAKIPVNCPLKFRTINPTNIHLYNIKLPSLTNGSTDNGNKIYGRICSRCHLKNNVRRQTHCPIPSCFNNQNNNSTPGQKRKVKGLKSLPLQWIEMSNDSEIKQRWANELNIPIDAKFGCARCVMRLSRRIGLVSIRDGKTTSDQLASSPGSALVNSPSAKEDVRKLWLDNGEIEKLRSLIKLHGKDWTTISANFSSDSPKTSNDCYKAYLYFKNEFQLNAALKEYYQTTGIDSDGTDGEIMSNSSIGGIEDLSGDEAVINFDGTNNNNETSDTASAASSNGGIGKPETDAVDPTILSKSNLQDYKPLSLSQGSLKSDYDSSATMSADESSNTNDNVDRSTGLYSFPRSNKFENQNNSTKTEDFKQSITPPNSTYSGLYSNRDKLEFDTPQVPTFLINPNAPSVSINANQTHHTTPPPSSSTLHQISSGLDHHNHRSNNNNNEISGINGGGTCVRDLIYKAIEISLQTEDKTQPTANNNTEQVKTPPVSSTGNISNGSSGLNSLNLKRDAPIQPQTLATDLSNKGVDQRKNLLNENIKPEGLAMNLSYGQRPLSRDESDICEAQDLSNKSKDRLSSRIYDGSNRHSPQNKIIKFDNRSSPLQISKPPFPSAHSIVDQRSVPFSTQLPYNTIQPAHSNNPTSRISNLMQESYINTVSILSNVDSPKSRSTTNPHQNPYNLPSSSSAAGSASMKINSKSQLGTFPISPKSETMIRDKIIQPSPIGSGSITQGTPVILQQPPPPSVSSQQPPLPPPSHASSQPYLALNSKFPPPPFHHYNESIFRHISNDYSKGSITQGTPLILNSNSVLLAQQPPLISTTSASSPHHSQLINIRNNNNTSNNNNKSNDPLDFVYSNKRMRYLDPKSAQPNIGYDLIDRFARNNYEVNSTLSHQTPPPPQQLPIYHRPFSPSPSNYSKLLAQSSVSNNQKDSHLNNHQIMIDFNTSKQMQPRRSSSSSEKEQTMPSSSSHPELQGARSIPAPTDKRSTPFHVSPAPSPASAIFLPTDRGEKIDQWNLANSSLINRQNVIQQCYPSVSKQSTSVIQTVPQTNPREFRDEISLKNSIMIPGPHYPPDNDALATLANTAIQQPNISVANSTPSSSTSIQSRLTKEGFEKCFSESLAPLPASSTKQAISNRIIYPPIGSSLNENNHSEFVADLSNKSNKDSSNDKLARNRDSRPSSVGHENNIDLSKMMQPRFVSSPFMLPHLSDHEKLLLEQKKYSTGNFPMDFPLLALQQQQSQQALAVDHRSTFRPEQFLAATTSGYFSNPGLKFAREQFSSEHFERELRQQMADNVAAIASNRVEQERLINKSDEPQLKSRKSSTNIDATTMDEASKLFSQSFQKDSQPNLTGNTGGITAANLIDAIITKQINTDSTKGPSSLGNYNTMLNRVKQQQQSLNCSPSTTPTPTNKTIMSTHSLAEERAIDFCIMNKIPATVDSFGSSSGNKSFGETILNMITDNIQNRSPTASPSSLVHNNSVRNKSSANQFEGIAATAVAASGSSSTTTTSANNFKLRRALQPVDKSEDYLQNKRLTSDVGNSAISLSSDSAIRQVIQMATSTTTTTSITATASSPSLSIPPIIKHIEPISPPTGTASGTALSSHQNWPWPFLPGFYPNKPIQFAPSRLPEPSTISHLPGHSDFFIPNRIAEVMQRSLPSTANNSNNSGSSNDGSENKSKTKITQLTKKSTFKNDDKSTMNNVDTDSTINSNKVHIDKISFPDSPSSPGEMVIDENRPPSTPSPSESNLTSDSSKNCIKKGSVIKVNETCSTPESSNNNTNTSNNDPQPQYEPLSDDES